MGNGQIDSSDKCYGAIEVIEYLRKLLGEANVLTGRDCVKWSRDWTGTYEFSPLAVVRPGSTEEVSAVMRYAYANDIAIVPVSGNTGLAGGTRADASLMISLDRMNKIKEVRGASRIAIVEAGVILSKLHDAVAEHDLIFPLTFGARGSAMLGGCLSTNAGGSNVLRYGNTRDLCLGLEVVLPNGDILNLMSELHKDNSGYNLRHLMIGAEGTLGIITGAVLKLFPRPMAYATAMVAAPDLAGALDLLNRLQRVTGGRVEAFEYMPRNYIEAHMAKFPGARMPFEEHYDVNLLVEIGSAAPADCTEDETGQIPLTRALEETLVDLMENGKVLDAVVAKTGAQRADMWARREAAAEIALTRGHAINNDIAVPLDKVATFLEAMEERLPQIDEGAETLTVSHLGDGNVHYTVFPKSTDPVIHDKIMEAVEDAAISLGGSFSAEHGIGTSKLPSMSRRKHAIALETMRKLKHALDPKGLLNPGKVLPKA